MALGDACHRLLVTQHRAQQFPNTTATADHSTVAADTSDMPDTSDGSDGPSAKRARYMSGQYDRIVCDVPCCGDGTLRKSPDMWRRWHPGFAIGLHTLQLQIAMRGLALLRVGGVMAYSTCTFNPVEDEAVVAALLRRSRGAIELVDASSLLGDLERRPGLNTWKVSEMRQRCDKTNGTSDGYSGGKREGEREK